MIVLKRGLAEMIIEEVYAIKTIYKNTNIDNEGLSILIDKE